MKFKSLIFSFVLASISGIFICIFVYWLACIISPPGMYDSDGEYHPTMPIGQVMISCIISAIISIVIWVLLYKKILAIFIKNTKA